MGFLLLFSPGTGGCTVTHGADQTYGAHGAASTDTSVVTRLEYISFFSPFHVRRTATVYYTSTPQDPLPGGYHMTPRSVQWGCV